MKIRRAVLAAAAVLALGVAPAAAHEPTCADVEFLGIEVHGQHVTRDYVIGTDGTIGRGDGAEIPGGPGPGFHFPNDVPPGASFCIPQAKSERALR